MTTEQAEEALNIKVHHGRHEDGSYRAEVSYGAANIVLTDGAPDDLENDDLLKLIQALPAVIAHLGAVEIELAIGDAAKADGNE